MFCRWGLLSFLKAMGLSQFGSFTNPFPKSPLLRAPRDRSRYTDALHRNGTLLDDSIADILDMPGLPRVKPGQAGRLALRRSNTGAVQTANPRGTKSVSALG